MLFSPTAGLGMAFVTANIVKKTLKPFPAYDLPHTTSSRLSTAMASGDKSDPAYHKYTEWRTERLKELWFLWDAEIRKAKTFCPVYSQWFSG